MLICTKVDVLKRKNISRINKKHKKLRKLKLTVDKIKKWVNNVNNENKKQKIKKHINEGVKVKNYFDALFLSIFMRLI